MRHHTPAHVEGGDAEEDGAAGEERGAEERGALPRRKRALRGWDGWDGWVGAWVGGWVHRQSFVCAPATLVLGVAMRWARWVGGISGQGPFHSLSTHSCCATHQVSRTAAVFASYCPFAAVGSLRAAEPGFGRAFRLQHGLHEAQRAVHSQTAFTCSLNGSGGEDVPAVLG